MKQKDIVLIIVVIFFSAVVSLVVAQTLFTTKENNRLTAEIVEPISSEFKEADKTVFNAESINPTQIIEIGGDDSPQNPF